MDSYLPLIELWESFRKKNKSGDLQEFAEFLLKATTKKEPMKSAKWATAQANQYFEKQTKNFGFEDSTPFAATLIWRLYKFIKLYNKNILQEAGLHSHDEFAILISIQTHQTIAKKVVITENLLELTTGTDIINRLIKNKLITEKINPDDKRQRMLNLTSKGATCLKTIFTGLASTEDILGNLSKEERTHLVSYLMKLNSFHTKLMKTES
jgi:DNA-binding MarR family transcriptional regulator